MPAAGFSFGGAAPTTTITANSGSAPAPAAPSGGFSFSGGAPTTTTTANSGSAPAAPSGGFSFGGAAPTSTAVPPTASTAAPAFGFGGGNTSAAPVAQHLQLRQGDLHSVALLLLSYLQLLQVDLHSVALLLHHSEAQLQLHPSELHQPQREEDLVLEVQLVPRQIRREVVELRERKSKNRSVFCWN